MILFSQMGAGLSRHKDEIVKTSNPTIDVKDDAEHKTSTETSEDDKESKCPMKMSDGSYRYDWGALFRKDFPHGPNGSRPMSPEQVVHEETQQEEEKASGCPVKHQEYNVYSQPIDPTNNMPKVANQLPAPNQTKHISTERVASSILKVGQELERVFFNIHFAFIIG